jgi:CRP-like cAMP-binding protein
MVNAPRELLPPEENLLLGILSGRTLSDARDVLTPVELRFGDILHVAYEKQDYVYFPTAGVVSTLYRMRNGESAELAVTGKSGMVGLAPFYDSDSSIVNAMVQAPGQAYRMPAKKMRALMNSDALFRGTLSRYAQVVMTQMIQTAVCNRYHSTEQQLARWILHSIDLVESNQIKMTQQLLAEMLGVRREGISTAATRFRAQGIIDYSRGEIRILKRDRLEAAACECYEVVVNETARLLPVPKKRGAGRKRIA